MTYVSNEQLRDLGLRLSEVYQETGCGLHPGTLTGVGFDRHHMRKWRRGDKDQIINWSATAKTGDYLQPIVWPYANDHDLDVMIFVDCDERLDWAGTDAHELKLSAQIQIAHLLCTLATLQSDSVGLQTSAGTLKMGASLKQIQTHLTKVQPGGAGLATSLSTFSRQNRNSALLVILISDFFGEGWQTPLKAISRRQEVMAVQVTDSWDFTVPANAGRQVIGGKRYNFSDARVRESYVQATTLLQTEVIAALKAANARHVQFSTREELVPQFITNFRRDERTARRHNVA